MVLNHIKQARADIDRAYNHIRRQINTLYYKLDDKIATVLANAQMNKVLGVDSDEQLALSPYVLKSLNQLTLVAMNGLISRNLSEDNKGVVTKNQRFLSSQLQLIDPDGSIAGLFAELLAQIESLDRLIFESDQTITRFDNQVSKSKADFDMAVQKTEIDTIVSEVQSDLDRANERLAMASRRSLTTVVIFLFIVPLLAISVGIFGLNRIIVTPITQLKDAMKYVEGGRFDTTAPIRAHDEIGQLAHAFNIMTAEIKAKVAEMSRLNQVLRDSQSKYKTLVNNLPQRIFLKDRNSVYVSCNRNFAADMNTTEEDIAGKTDFDLFPNALAEKYRRDDVRVLLAEKPEEIEETYTSGGEKFYVRTLKTPIRNDQGEVSGLLGIFWDITERKRAEESLRLTQFCFDKASIGIHRIDEAGRILDVNEQECRNLGYTREALCRLTVFDIDPDYTPDRYADLMAKLRQIRAHTIETRHQRRNGEIYPVQLQLNFTQYEDQEFIVAFEEDITQRKQAEAALRESQQRLDLALSGANEGIWDWNIVEDRVYLDTRYYTMAGYQPNEFPPNFDEIVKRIHEDDVERTLSVNERYLVGKLDTFEVEYRFLRRDGSYMWIQARGKIVSRDADGAPTRFIGTNADITDRKQAAKALRENEQLLNNILESINEGIMVLDRDFRCTIWNDAMARIVDSPKEKAIGKILWEAFPALENSPVIQNIKNTIRGISTGNLEIMLPLPNGETAWFSDNFSPLRNTNGRIIGVVGVVSDISQRKQDEENLHRLRNFLSNIIDSMPSVLVAVDQEGKVTQWNNHAEQITGMGFEAVQSQPLSQVFPRLADEMVRIQTAIQERRVISTPNVPQKFKQETRFEDITIFPLVANGVEGAVIRVDDVTERVRLEEMMIQSEKMLSVGGLAAGMAHEINNPLAGMMQTAEVMANRLVTNLHIPANRKTAEDVGTTLDAIEQFMASRGIPRMLATINESGRRVAAIVENMLSFARKSESMVSSHDLGRLMDKTLELAATDYDLKKQYDFRRIVIERDYGNPTIFAPCDAAKIQQVLLNILRNGAQAMQEARTELPRFILRTRVEVNRAMAVIEIEDNGPGMDEPTRKRIFEPFFTTKPVGVGTGLGLSVSYFIITENHHGEMSVESGLGTGTKFIIRLPMEGAREEGPETC